MYSWIHCLKMKQDAQSWSTFVCLSNQDWPGNKLLQPICLYVFIQFLFRSISLKREHLTAISSSAVFGTSSINKISDNIYLTCSTHEKFWVLNLLLDNETFSSHSLYLLLPQTALFCTTIWYIFTAKQPKPTKFKRFYQEQFATRIQFMQSLNNKLVILYI